MKKYGIYIGILALGLLLGWLLFKDSNKELHNHNTTEIKQMWTCSMHPQIMQAEPGQCPICGMDLIPAHAGADGLNPNEIKLTKNAMALANIETTIVGNEKMNKHTEKQGLVLSGKIQQNEKSEEIQVSHFSGRIEKLNINFVGEKVSKEQLVATIYSPELVNAQQELITTSALKTSQPELYQAVRDKLKLWKLSENQINQIENSGKIQDNVSVYAGVSGTVSEMMVQQGDYVNRGQGLFKIDNLNSLWAIFDVYENEIAKIKVGQIIKISTNAYPNKVFSGTVSFIYPTLDEKTRTVKVRADIANNGNLKPGMFIEGSIKLASNTDAKAVSIPATAVLWTGKRSVVYVKTNADEPIFEMREIEVETQTGETYNVLSGLEYGEEIVSNGAFTVDAAAQLQGKKSMMNQEKESAGVKGNEVKDEKLNVPNDFKNQLKSVFAAYLKLKDELVNSDAEKVQANAKAIIKSLENVDMKLLKDNKTHEQWMTFEKGIKEYADKIKATTDIEKQRQFFKPLSYNLIQAVEIFGINQKVYKQYCPMADSNSGAFWLSEEKEIRNPYYGEKMLKCGEVKAEIE